MVTKAFKKAEDAGPVDVSELEKIAVDCVPVRVILLCFCAF